MTSQPILSELVRACVLAGLDGRDGSDQLKSQKRTRPTTRGRGKTGMDRDGRDARWQMADDGRWQQGTPALRIERAGDWWGTWAGRWGMELGRNNEDNHLPAVTSSFPSQRIRTQPAFRTRLSY